MKAKLAEVLRVLGSEIGRDDLVLEPGKPLVMELDNGICAGLEYEEESGDLILFSYLSEVPKSQIRKQDLFENLLEWNALQIGSLGGVLAYHKPANSVLYSMRLTIMEDAAPEALKTSLFSFAARAAYLVEQINSIDSSGSSESAAPAANAMMRA